MPILPPFTQDDAERIVLEQYGLVAAARSLPGEMDRNFQITAQDGSQFTLKIAHINRTIEKLDFENQAMLYLVSRGSRGTPQVVPASNGDLILQLPGADGREYLARMVTYLPGRMLVKVQPHGRELLYRAGAFLARFDRNLAGFEHPAMHRDFLWDMTRAGEAIQHHLKSVADPARRKTADHFMRRFETLVQAQLAGLRSQVIQNDANDYNLLVHDREISGLIDFGDMIHAPVVCEPAIAAAYAVLDKADPLRSAADLVSGYHAENPLSDVEISLLYDLIACRLCVSAVTAAYRAHLYPDRPYLQVTAEPAWQALEKWVAIHPDFAHLTFRAACGQPPAPPAQLVSQWLADNQDALGPLVAGQDAAVIFDLSPPSPLAARASEGDTEGFTEVLFAEMRRAGAAVGIGRYNEPRLIYRSDLFKVPTDDGPEWRSIHIGLDLFAEAGTPVLAPIDGVVHSFANNAAHLDYGPTILLAHETTDGTPFFTLYGHLALESLDGLVPGQEIRKGTPFAWIGSADVNGGWPPHLHFQVITHLFGASGEFPGVARPSERSLFTAVCPDPSVFIRRPEAAYEPPRFVGDTLLAVRQQRVGFNLSLSYEKHLHIVRGLGKTLFDIDGQPYLDCVNNVSHVGHSHPQVYAALAQQARVLNTNTRYLHENIVRYAERLTGLLPDPLSVCFFVNSGSEANDLAIRMTRSFTGQRDMLVLEGAYHGNLSTLIELSPYKHAGPGGEGPGDWVHVLPMPCAYRGIHRESDDPAGSYAHEAVAALGQLQAAGKGVAGFISEAIIGTGGQVVFPDGTLAGIYEAVRTAGGLCIADEVQAGFGRVGAHFWAFETQGVVPDIVTMGKPIGNGHPLAAVVTTPAIASAFHNGMEYFNTFGGNPVSCAVGLAVLDVIEQEGLQARARTVGNQLKAGLKNLQAAYPLIGDVRGSGLFLGIELVREGDRGRPAAEEAAYVVERMRSHGILLSTDGPLHNVIKIKPPLVFNEDDAARVLAGLQKVLAEVSP